MATTLTRITPEVRDSISQANESLDLAINILLDEGVYVGLASQLGDVRDLLNLLASDQAADLLAG